MLTFWVYILECSDGSYYTGHTDDMDARLYAHIHGLLPCYTRSRRPVKLVYCQEFSTRDEAFTAERQIKGWSRRKKQALIANDWDKLVEYSKAYSRKKEQTY